MPRIKYLAISRHYETETISASTLPNNVYVAEPEAEEGDLQKIGKEK